MQKFPAGKFHFEPPFTSFDHLVGEGEQRRRNRQAERLGDLQIDDEIEFNRLLDRQIGRLRSAQNPVNITSGAPELVSKVYSIGHQTSASTLSREPCIVGSRASSANALMRMRLVFISASA